MDPGTVAELLVALLLGGGGVHALHRRRANGAAREDVTAEVLRQKLYEARHGEVLRTLGGVAETSANSAQASEKAAAAAERSAGATERMACALEEHLDRIR